MTTARRAEVAPERLTGWVERFAASHGQVSWSVATAADRGTSAPSGSWSLRAADGSWAGLTSWNAPPSTDPSGPSVAELERWAAPPSLLLLLVRRGGYAVGVASSTGELVAHKVGTRYVQSRTAAGGWSQQRYARRRANQADAMVEAVAGHAGRVLADGEAAVGAVGGLVLGGDRSMAAEVLAEVATGPRAALDAIPRRVLPDLPDPRRAVLDTAVERARAVLVEVLNA